MLPPTELPATTIRLPSASEVMGVDGNPFQSSVAFFELRWIFTFRKRRVFDENTDLAGTNHEVTQQALMVLKVADDPNTTMNEQQHPWFVGHMLGRHDV